LARLLIISFVSVFLGSRDKTNQVGVVSAQHAGRGRRVESVAGERNQRAQDRARVGPQVHGLRAGQAAPPRLLLQGRLHLRALRRRLLRRRIQSDGYLSIRGKYTNYT